MELKRVVSIKLQHITLKIIPVVNNQVSEWDKVNS